MNRHARRAAKSKTPHAEVSKTLEGIREFASIAEEFKPYLAQIGALQAQLESATQILRELENIPQDLRALQDENRALRGELKFHAAVFRRMFARGMDVPLDTIVSMETEIHNALKTVQSAPEGSTEDSGARTQP
jgi:vacuolar-type H+-ATPase subunit C/Vma6